MLNLDPILSPASDGFTQSHSCAASHVIGVGFNCDDMTKRTAQLLGRIQDLGFTWDEAYSLRRIEMTLQRWAERECGDGSDWAIERDETTGKPFNVYHGEGKPRRYAIADREAGALRRLGKIMEAHSDFVAYHQGDCRGCMLYLVPKSSLAAGERLDSVYTRGVAVCD
jgi:hypothetical protein